MIYPLAHRLMLSKEALQRMKERGITSKMIEVALEKGTSYWDPKNYVVNYVLEGGFASGKTLLVGQNPVTKQITTVIRGHTRKILRPRFIKLSRTI